jgi:cytoskeletal protein RodZ
MIYDGKLFKDKRAARNLSQKEASEITGINLRIISQIENGTFDGGLKYLIKYMKLLKLEFNIFDPRATKINQTATQFNPPESLSSNLEPHHASFENNNQITEKLDAITVAEKVDKMFNYRK